MPLAGPSLCSEKLNASVDAATLLCETETGWLSVSLRRVIVHFVGP